MPLSDESWDEIWEALAIKASEGGAQIGMHPVARAALRDNWDMLKSNVATKAYLDRQRLSSMKVQQEHMREELAQLTAQIEEIEGGS
jgi:hypothetical protein